MGFIIKNANNNLTDPTLLSDHILYTVTSFICSKFLLQIVLYQPIILHPLINIFVL